MNLNPRPIGLAVLLLLFFLGAAVGLQGWLLRKTRQLQGLAVEEQRQKLERIVAVNGLSPEQWDAQFQRDLSAMLGGTVTLHKAGTPPPPAAGAGSLGFAWPLPAAPAWEVQVDFATPALVRIQVLHQRILAAVVLLALLLAIVPLLVAALASRRSAAADGIAPAPWAESRAQAAGFEQLARLSNERSAALAREHAARARAEEDLAVNRNLLGRSVAERVRLGRELHDNICQTLYAVALTLDSVAKKTSLSPEMGERMGQCIAELRRLNQEVRTFLQDLEPGRVNSQSFAAALASLLGSLPAEDESRIERRLDAATLELIPSQQVAEIMNILREAVSNSLRHAQARHIVLRAGQSDQAIALSVQDDGVGFAGADGPGHGLHNMRARAQALGGHLAVESAPGKGTRVILSLPLPQVA